MLNALIALNVVLWLVFLVYALRLAPPLRRGWHWLGVVAGLVVVLSAGWGTWRWSKQQQRRQLAAKHYWAALDEKNRGDLEAAERDLQRSLQLEPGNPQAQQALAEVRQAKEERPVARREQQITQPATPEKPRLSDRGRRPPAHRPSPFEITRYELDVEIEPVEHRLTGTASIFLASRGGPLRQLDFSLSPEFKPTGVSRAGQPLRFTHTNDLLSVQLPAPWAGDAQTPLVVQYARSGSPLVEGGDLISSQGTYLRSEARWYPATGELDFRAPVRVRVIVPKGITAVSVGKLEQTTHAGGKSTFVWNCPRPAAMIALAAGKYVPLTTKVGPTTITTYLTKPRQKRAKAYLQEGARIVKYYNQLLGPYPYEKLAIVEIPHFPGGYGATSLVMLLDLVFDMKQVDREFLGHEIAHQWWGNSVFPQGPGAAWLSEAFANYSAWMYEGSVGGPKLLQKRLNEAADRYWKAVVKEQKADQPIRETDPYAQAGAYEQIIYDKGAWVLHLLRREVGDAAFKRILRRACKEYAFGKMNIEQFQRLAEAEAGKPLAPFFEQWLGRPGGLQFAYSFKTEPVSAKENACVLQVTQKGPPFRARLDVTFDVENQIVRSQVNLTEAQQTFRIPVKGRVSVVQFDPNRRWLMRPPEWVPAP